MPELTFDGLPQVWWPYAFILLAGWVPTDVWRYLGVVSAGSISEDSTLIQLVRAIATALVAAVIARLVFFPSGSLAEIPDWARIGGLAIGFLTYAFAGRSIIAGIAASQIVLMAGAWQAGLVL